MADVTADEVLTRAWSLGVDGFTKDAGDELEALLLILITAGYAQTYEGAWNFTPEGVSRIADLAGNA